MNRKGQVLVLFVLLLPVVMFALILIFDFTYVKINENRLEKIANNAALYITKNKEIEEIEKIILSNDPDIEIIEITSSNIHLKHEIKSIFGNFINEDRYILEVNLSFYIENNELKIIEKG